MKRALTTSNDNLLAAQPDAAGEKIILRSNDAADTTQTLTLSGDVSSSPDSESLAVSGQKEVQSTKVFESLAAAILDAALSGTGTILGQGTAGTGDIRVDSVPADGDQLVLGLAGHLRTYTLRSPGRGTLQCVAASSLSQGDYFDLTLAGTTRRFWYDIDAAGTGAPADPGGGLHEIDILSGDTADDVAGKTQTVIDALANYNAGVTTDTLTITGVILGALAFADGAAATGFTWTEVESGTADAADQIRTGYDVDGSAATTADVAGWIDAALNADGTAGQEYGTGTAQHADLQATGASGSLVTLSDRMACARQLAWSSTGSAAGFTIRMPSEGVDGATLGTFNGITQLLATAADFDNETLAADNLAPGVLYTGDSIFLGGKPFALYFKSEQTAAALTRDYQVSNDNSTWRDGESAIGGDSSSATASDRDRFIAPAERAEYIRMRITGNSETVARAAHFILVSG